VATTAELIRRGARQHRGRTATLCGDERLTFTEADELASRIANVLLGRGHERIGLLVENSLWSVPLDFACAKARIARVPLNPRLGAVEQREILRLAGLQLLVSDRPAELGAEVLPLDGLLELARAGSAVDAEVPVSAGDPLLLIATSGTTGRIKLVQHTQGSYAAIAANILANLLYPRRDDVMLHAASLIHASGTFVLPFWLRGGASAVLPDGWVRTRDVGRFDDEGFLYLVDRTSDMIVSGGYNVYPREVEDVLATHPGVRECAVVGAPDEHWVEAVTAFVVGLGGVTEPELIEHCRGTLAGYKVPKSVHFIDEIPKSPVGKILRRALRDPLWERHERPI
jgi:acyl-CoA synthetase (AMP-forming)/AMP-acid ligase II